MTPAIRPLIKVTSGPLDLEFIGHSDVASYDAEAGYAGAALEFADRWHIHRDTINVFDEEFTPFVEQLTGITRMADEKLTAKRRSISPNPDKITPIPERFLTYIKRVFAKVSEPVQEQIKAEALIYSRRIAISAAPAERTAPIEPMFYKRADSLLENDIETIDEKVAKYLTLVPNYEVARDSHSRPLRDSLARLLQRYDAARYALED